MTAYEAALQDMVKRIEALERGRKQADEVIKAFGETYGSRISELEAAHGGEHTAECERLGRWHATYNAVRRGCARHGDDGNKAHRYAMLEADRAHGPLEAKAEPNNHPMAAKWTYGDLNELVKAAAQAVAYFRAELAPTSDVLLFLDGISDALKPFEAAK